jgi:TRAP-type C4-dicarboxylate transport system permease small subunit
LSALLNIAGIGLILAMVLLIVTDVLSRLLFNIALQGQYELVEYIMGLVIVFALGYTQVRNGHVCITSAIDLLPRKMRSWTNRLVNVIGFLIFGLITYETLVKAGMEIEAGTTSAVLYIPKYPFMYACAFGFTVLTLVYLMQILLPDESGQKTEEQPDLIV